MRILSLDGGGIRGVLEARFLERLEADLGGKSLYDCFDLVAGTSTGGLIALHLAGNKASGASCAQLYSPENAQTIMDKSLADRLLPFETEPKYDGEGKTEVLDRIFGEKRLNDVEKKVLVTAYDIVERKAVIFKSFGGSDAAYNPELAEVGDATSAAPTYFPTIRTENNRWLVDGGVAANDPGMCALVAAMNEGVALTDIKMLSIGTGNPTRKKEDPNKLGKESQGWGGIGWLKNGLIDHLFAGNSSTASYQCRQLLGDDRYLRVNGDLIDVSDDLDEVSRKNIKALRRLADKWYEQFGAAARALCA
ncbi:MAG: patatin-like phospholipase family protein [Magnetococcales bacterium]|nr:patatin-like phospholipase family protein [Magnetococcales bacterium]